MESRLAASARVESRPATPVEKTVEPVAPSVPDETGEEAAPAAITPAETEPTASPNGATTADEEGFVWPEGAAPQAEPAVANVPAAEDAPLPKLDELTKRIPPSVRETLDDLFRARFVAVHRVSPKTLKT